MSLLGRDDDEHTASAREVISEAGLIAPELLGVEVLWTS